MQNNFKFKKEYSNIIKGMTDKQAGEFVKGICEYAFDNKPIKTKDSYLKGAFLYIKREIDTSRINSINGKKGGEICAEKQQARRRKAAYNNGIITGGVVAEKAIEGFLKTVKK